MTREQALRWLDAAVAEHVMGWTVCRDPDCHGCDASVSLLSGFGWAVRKPHSWGEWAPSSDPAAMLEVLEEMRRKGWEVDMAGYASGWLIRVRKPSAGAVFHDPARPRPFSVLPLAATLAVLNALSVDIPGEVLDALEMGGQT